MNLFLTHSDSLSRQSLEFSVEARYSTEPAEKDKKLWFNKVVYTSRSNVMSLRTFARNFSNIDFFLKILPLKDHK